MPMLLDSFMVKRCSDSCDARDIGVCGASEQHRLTDISLFGHTRRNEIIVLLNISTSLIFNMQVRVQERK